MVGITVAVNVEFITGKYQLHNITPINKGNGIAFLQEFVDIFREKVKIKLGE